MVDTSIGEAEEITVAHELTARQSGEENVMDARMGVEAITSRIGAIALPLGIILLVVATAFHPSREAAMDNPAVFMEYAQSDIWVTVHLIQWVAFLLVFSGMGALYCSITTKSDLHAAVARFGLAAVVLTAATHTMLQAVTAWPSNGRWTSGQALPLTRRALHSQLPKR